MTPSVSGGWSRNPSGARIKRPRPFGIYAGCAQAPLCKGSSRRSRVRDCLQYFFAFTTPPSKFSILTPPLTQGRLTIDPLYGGDSLRGRPMVAPTGSPAMYIKPCRDRPPDCPHPRPIIWRRMMRKISPNLVGEAISLPRNKSPQASPPSAKRRFYQRPHPGGGARATLTTRT